jgi:hypothetical protein
VVYVSAEDRGLAPTRTQRFQRRLEFIERAIRVDEVVAIQDDRRVVVMRAHPHGDFEALISEGLFYRVQAILSGRAPSTAPRKRGIQTFRCAASFGANRAAAA